MVGLLLFAVSASAQDEAEDALRNVPRIQIAAGYSSLRDVDLHQSIPGGWFFSADKNINDRLGITYDLSASGTVTRHLAFLPGHVTRWGTGALLLGPTFSNRDHGRFVALSGYEVIESPANLNFSRGLLFTFAAPLAHNGLLGSYRFNDMVDAQFGVVNGWNTWIDDDSEPAIIGRKKPTRLPGRCEIVWPWLPIRSASPSLWYESMLNTV